MGHDNMGHDNMGHDNRGCENVGDDNVRHGTGKRTISRQTFYQLVEKKSCREMV